MKKLKLCQICKIFPAKPHCCEPCMNLAEEVAKKLLAGKKLTKDERIFLKCTLAVIIN